MDTNNLQGIVASSKQILVVLPKDPNFDTVAAGLSLAASFQKFGRRVNVFCPTPMLVEFNRLVGVEKVTQRFGERNLIITLTNYPATNIEKVSYNIENGQMQLTVIPKEDVLAPREENITPSFGGVASDAVIFVGVSGAHDLGENFSAEISKIPKQIAVVARPSSPTMPRRGGVNELFDSQASCISETVGWILSNGNFPLDEDISGNLMAGITTATKNFTAQGVRSETFELASKLLKAKSTSGRHTQDIQREPGNSDDGALQKENTPPDWLKPKIYKGSTLP